MIDIVNSVKQFTPTFLNIDNSSLLASHANMIATVDKNNEEAQKYKSDLEIAVANLPMNEKEDNFKANLLQEIENATNDNASVLGIGTSYNALVKKYGDIMKSPAVKGRVEAQKAYTDFKNSILNNKDLSQDEKDYFLQNPNNQYNYVDKIDENTENIVGGTRWSPGRIPTPNANIEEIVPKAIKYAAEHKGKNGWYKFIGADGKETKDFTKAVTAQFIKEGSNSWEELKEQDITDAILEIIQRDPMIMNKLDEQYDIAQWYDKNNPEKRNADGTSLYGYRTKEHPDGTSLAEFIADKFNDTARVASYKNAFNEVSVKEINKGNSGGSGITDQTKLLSQLNITTHATPVEFEYNVGNNAENKCREVASNLKNSLVNNRTGCTLDSDGKLHIGSTIIDFNNIKDNDTKNMINEIDKMNLTEEEKMRYKQDITSNMYVYKQNKLVYDYMLSKCNTDELRSQAKLLFSMDNDGFKLDINDPLQKEILNSKEEFYTEADGITGNTKLVDQKRVFLPNALYNNIKQIAQERGINLSNIGFTEIDSENNDKGQMISLAKDDNVFMQFCILYSQARDNLFAKGLFTTSDNVTGEYFNAVNKVSNLLSKAKSNVDGKFKIDHLIMSNENLPENDFASQAANELIGYIKSGDWNITDKQLQEDIKNKVYQANFNQYRVFGLSEKDGHGTLTDMIKSKDRTEINDIIRRGIDKDNCMMSAAYIPGLGAGTNITVHVYDDKGKDTGETQQYFIPRLINSEYLEKFENDPSTQARKNVMLATQNVGQQIFLSDNKTNPALGEYKLISSDNEGFIVKCGNDPGKYIDKTQAQKLNQAFIIYNQLKNAYNSKELFFDKNNKIFHTENTEEYNKINNALINEIRNLAGAIAEITNYGDTNMVFSNLLNDLKNY